MQQPSSKRQKISSTTYKVPLPTTPDILNPLINYQWLAAKPELNPRIRPRNDPARKRSRIPSRILRPRAPDVTVTASVVNVQVDEGTSASTTQIAVPTTNSVLSVGSLAVEIPSATTASSVSNLSQQASSSSSSSSPSVVASATDTSVHATATSQLVLSSSFNGNATAILNSSSKTVTVTTTSSLHVSVGNGTISTIFGGSGTSQSTPASHTGSQTSDSAESTQYLSALTYATYTFGQGVTGSYTPATITGTYQNGVYGTATGTVSSATSSSTSSGGGAGPAVAPLTPAQQQVVGGVVGGVAGVAFVLVVVLYVLRWYRARLKASGNLPGQINLDSDYGTGRALGATGVSEKGAGSLIPASLAGVLGLGVARKSRSWKPGSMLTASTSTTALTTPVFTGDGRGHRKNNSNSYSEKGFHRISGRKIPPVLSTGGDQYGGNYGAFEPANSRTNLHDPLPNSQQRNIQSPPIIAPQPWSATHQRELSASSCYRDSGGFYNRSSTTSPVTHHPSTGYFPTIPEDHDIISPTRAGFPEGYAVIRNSPARTPVTESPSTLRMSQVLPIQTQVSMDDDVPAMPLSPPQNFNLGLDIPGASNRQRMPSQTSMRSGHSGKFKEEI